ncbi:MAG TPA: glycoside hydrolase family 2 protein [Clostridiales bacterium]|nr:glycoside hydrolase family 2 protein [Clostridiales bacterium]
MKRLDLNYNWDFYESNEGMSFVFHKPESKVVNLPHDFIITKPRSPKEEGGPGNGYFGQGEGVYRKQLEVPPEWEGKTVILDIDGAYMNTEVALNGDLLGLHPYGYTPYLVDLSPALRFNGKKNELKIITQSRQPSSRWYSGGGIYRSVALWVGNPVHIRPWDIFVTTPVVNDGEATVNVNITVSSKEEKERAVTLACEILDAEGREVAEGSLGVSLSGKSSTVCDLELKVEHPKQWDLDTPYLYTCRVKVMADGAVLDESQDTFGIRTISIDTEHGFMLNGRTVKMQGGCLHHDNAFLGACAYPKAEARKISILKAVGYNAVRISHYPPSLAMLKACDEQGMLLLDECFDVWRMGKVPLDYHLYFEDWWERDIELMVKRDRNHPCVITYSIGNEVGERDGKGEGALWAKRLHDKFKALDPTRFTMSGICGIFDDDAEVGTNFDANAISDNNWGEVTKAFAEPLDIVGYNYLYERYEKDHETFPDRIIVGSETHSFKTYDNWEAVKKNPHVIGDFIWAAVDYLGEVGTGKVYWEKAGEPFGFMAPYPWRSSWQSDILLTGKRRPQSYYREIMWGHTRDTYLFTTHPEHYGDNFFGMNWHWYDVNEDWSFPEEYLGKPVKVDAYGSGDEAEFILNGRSLGRAPYNKLIATMDIPYEKGTLEAVTYEQGVEISRATLKTAGQATALLLTPEENQLAADLQDLCYIHVDIVDGEGIRLPSDERELQVTLSGPGEFLAIGSGSPCTEDQIGDTKCHAYHGRAVVILKAGAPGEIRVTVTAEGVAAGTCVVQALQA